VSNYCPLCEAKAKEIERLNGLLEPIESDEQLWKRGEEYQKRLATADAVCEYVKKKYRLDPHLEQLLKARREAKHDSRQQSRM